MDLMRAVIPRHETRGGIGTMQRSDALNLRAFALQEEHDAYSDVDEPLDVQRLLAWYYAQQQPQPATGGDSRT
jgi:hypothetical protein